MRPKSLAVIGLGAIGGSVAWQARHSGVERVVGFSLPADDAEAALEAGALNAIAKSASDAAAQADLVVLATPPRAAMELLATLAPVLAPGAVLTDVASVKAAIVQRAVALRLGERFAGGHPLAGTHGSGWSFAAPARFAGCTVYVTPTGSAGAAAADAVCRFWGETMSARPVVLTAAEHDAQLAWTSHLPQMVATALAHTLGGRHLPADAYGTGARDTTRLAASSPDLWLEILTLNRVPLLEALRGLEGDLTELRQRLEASDSEGLRRWLAEAQRFREGLL